MRVEGVSREDVFELLFEQIADHLMTVARVVQEVPAVVDDDVRSDQRRLRHAIALAPLIEFQKAFKLLIAHRQIEIGEILIAEGLHLQELPTVDVNELLDIDQPLVDVELGNDGVEFDPYARIQSPCALDDGDQILLRQNFGLLIATAELDQNFFVDAVDRDAQRVELGKNIGRGDALVEQVEAVRYQRDSGARTLGVVSYRAWARRRRN